eukprot:TRINITY_DN21323_c0_g1_i1.p1 TRINITY_DN21323_c0_g1~~TRINITY_DN21323_c0_g1_i1.p1  ORF type:complete len:660 (+),score=112.16 TRINITY_DN21323_c0_g1_i1:120-2099(+)
MSDSKTGTDRLRHSVSEIRERIQKSRSSPRVVISSKSSGRKHEMSNWSLPRRMIATVTLSLPFELTICTIVFFNAILLIVEVDASTTCDKEDGSCSPSWVELMNHVLLGIYTAELAAQLYVVRSEFWRSAWSYLDLSIVFIGYLEICIKLVLESGSTKGMGYSRMLRMARMLRLIRIFRPIPELYRLISGFASTLRTILWGFVLILILIAMWSMVTVEVVNSVDVPDLESYCSDAYKSVLQTGLLYWQILIAQDSWGRCTIPVVKEAPSMFWIYAAVLVTVQLGFTNLILAVIVDAAAAARDADIEQKAEARKREELDDVKTFETMLRKIDKDSSGTISIEEFHEGFDQEIELQNRLLALGLDRDDLIHLMGLMDADNSGELEYSEFTSAMLKAEKQDIRIQFMFLRMAMDFMTFQFQERMAAQDNMLELIASNIGVPMGEINRLSASSHPAAGVDFGRGSATQVNRRSGSTADSPRSSGYGAALGGVPKIRASSKDSTAQADKISGTESPSPAVHVSAHPYAQNELGLGSQKAKCVSEKPEELEESYFQKIGLNEDCRLQALVNSAAEHAAASALQIAKEVVEILKEDQTFIGTSGISAGMPTTLPRLPVGTESKKNGCKPDHAQARSSSRQDLQKYGLSEDMLANAKDIGQAPIRTI